MTSGIVGAAPALSLLLEYGADPTAVNRTDVTPLREAARVDDAEMFRVLLENGAGPRVSPQFVRTNCYKCADLIGATLARKPLNAIGAYLESWRERAIQNLPIAGGTDTISYLLFGLAPSAMRRTRRRTRRRSG